MKKYLIWGVVVAILMIGSLGVSALSLPEYVGYVNDFAEVLSPSDEATIDATLTQFEKETSNEVAVVTIKSLEGLDRFTYSQELFMKWGVGKEGKNNGILFLIVPPEREAFINVGKGLEGAFTDAHAGTILRNEVFPKFREEDYAGGITLGVNAIIAATKGEYTADPNVSQEDESIDSTGAVMLFFFGFVLLQYLVSFLARSKSWWLGGVLGGAGGGVGGWLLGAGIIFPALILGVFGLLTDFIVSKNYQARKAAGKPTDFWHSGGGFWFGGGGGFGGSSGGGFGGFGGGMSGGGGAGGRW